MAKEERKKEELEDFAPEQPKAPLVAKTPTAPAWFDPAVDRIARGEGELNGFAQLAGSVAFSNVKSYAEPAGYIAVALAFVKLWQYPLRLSPCCLPWP